jgi:hypothetical protein
VGRKVNDKNRHMEVSGGIHGSMALWGHEDTKTRSDETIGWWDGARIARERRYNKSNMRRDRDGRNKRGKGTREEGTNQSTLSM